MPHFIPGADTGLAAPGPSVPVEPCPGTLASAPHPAPPPPDNSRVLEQVGAQPLFPRQTPGDLVSPLLSSGQHPPHPPKDKGSFLKQKWTWVFKKQNRGKYAWSLGGFLRAVPHLVLVSSSLHLSPCSCHPAPPGGQSRFLQHFLLRHKPMKRTASF